MSQNKLQYETAKLTNALQKYWALRFLHALCDRTHFGILPVAKSKFASPERSVARKTDIRRTIKISRGFLRAPEFLTTGSVSPVIGDSSTVTLSRKYPSAGIMSPASSRTISPGTTCDTETGSSFPSRRTRVFRSTKLFNDCSAFGAIFLEKSSVH